MQCCEARDAGFVKSGVWRGGADRLPSVRLPFCYVSAEVNARRCGAASRGVSPGVRR
ncbi:hypothetical protein B0G80_6297 [Paraburkholderia sp. BL6669N2]|nr:hypothetical protein B0G80_6297 [Paraburkholderia sp. BL6669N2]